MFIQAMDLAIIVPLCVMAGFLLLRRSAWGYLLASVGLLKFLTMGVAVSLMGFNMARVGVPVSVVELVVFPSHYIGQPGDGRFAAEEYQGLKLYYLTLSRTCTLKQKSRSNLVTRSN